MKQEIWGYFFSMAFLISSWKRCLSEESKNRFFFSSFSLAASNKVCLRKFLQDWQMERWYHSRIRNDKDSLPSLLISVRKVASLQLRLQNDCVMTLSSFIDPLEFKTCTHQQFCTMNDDPIIRRSDFKFLTNFFRFLLMEKFCHKNRFQFGR